MSLNRALIFKKVPTGSLPVPGEDLATEPVTQCNLNSAPANGILVQSLYASFDPYMRGRMRGAERKSYVPAYKLGTPVDTFAIGKVLKTNNPAYQEGQLVIGELPIQEYVAVEETSISRVRPLENPLGLEDIGKPKRGETIFVSAASGAVGQLVGQLAKREGLRVIGSVGSDEKLAYILNELGFDAGFNYKREKPREALARLAPEGINIYYDNVGGGHLEAALDALNDFGRVVACGMISDVSGEPYPVKNIHAVITKRLYMQGFIVADAEFGPAYFMEHQANVQRWIKDGSIKCLFHETVGVENAAEGLVGIFEGKNKGKALLKF